MILDYIIHLYLKVFKKRIDYDKYMNTKHWKRIKRKTLKRCSNKCMFCGTHKGTLILHHNNYLNLYAERKSDVIIMCKACHETLHFYRWKPKKDIAAS